MSKLYLFHHEGRELGCPPQYEGFVALSSIQHHPSPEENTSNK